MKEDIIEIDEDGIVRATGPQSSRDLAGLLASQEPPVCVHGHKSKQVGCVSCELLFRSREEPPTKDEGDLSRVVNEMLVSEGQDLPQRPPESQFHHVLMSRAWAMPSSETFSMSPVTRLMAKWLAGREVVVDPFARNSKWGTLRNDLSLATDAEYHMEARDFLRHLVQLGVEADALLFDPPYSPRQIQEAYQSIGRRCGKEDTQSARLYAECRDIATALLVPGAIVISCGWNSGGFGKKRGFVQREILLVAHGAAHNDTIVTVEEKLEVGATVGAVDPHVGGSNE
jgi:hypothetical protein